MIRGLKVGFTFCFLAMSSSAMAQGYSAWSDPNKVVANPQLEQFIDQLDKLVTNAEKSRAADPQFLRDLRDLMNKPGTAPASSPTSRLIFKDDFLDGDFTRNPVWTVASGKYWIEKGYGLRTFVEQTGASSNNQAAPSPQKLSNEELVIGILGAVLGAQNQQRQEKVAEPAPSSNVKPSEIYFGERVSNAFSLSMDFSSWVQGGQLEFGPYQGANRKTGYRLLYRSGQSPSLQLIRDYSSSSTVLASVNGVALEDQKNHKLDWVREPGGRMSVSLNGKALINLSDQGFRDDFNGFVIRNLSGDYIFKSISMTGR